MHKIISSLVPSPRREDGGIKGFIEPEHKTHIKTSSTTNLDQNLFSGQDTPFQGSPLASEYKQIPKSSAKMVLKDYWTACQGPEARPSCYPRWR